MKAIATRTLATYSVRKTGRKSKSVSLNYKNLTAVVIVINCENFPKLFRRLGYISRKRGFSEKEKETARALNNHKKKCTSCFKKADWITYQNIGF